MNRKTQAIVQVLAAWQTETNIVETSLFLYDKNI